MAESQLCLRCQGLNADSIIHPPGGYRHSATRDELTQSAKTCPMCELMRGTLSNNRGRATPQEAGDRSVVCRFARLGDEGEVVLRVDCEDSTGIVHVYTRGDGPGCGAFYVLLHAPRRFSQVY
jgi:hypothetical protein